MFLETVTFMGNDILIRIDHIKCVYITYSDGSHKIVIKMDDENKNEYIECFQCEDKLVARYQEIKSILNSK